MADFQAVMAELEALGTAQNCKIYKRHGASGPMFGVSYGNLNKLVKKIKNDHALASKLWETGNHDARILAMKIADPAQADSKQLESWARDLGDYVVTDALSDYISKTDLMQDKAERWLKSDKEWIGTAGWNLLGYLAIKDPVLPDSYFEPYLDTIVREIHGRKNRVRYAMNNAVIQIGSRNDALAEKAIAASEEIGVVDVDHGETSCLTPDAASYIEKVRARKQKT